MIAKLTVGLFFRGEVRRFLAEAKFCGEVSDWTEIKGSLDSRFLIRGPSASVVTQIDRWVNDVNTQVVS